MPSLTSKIKRRVAKVPRKFEDWYRAGYIRNKILASKSRDKTEQFVAGGNRYIVFLVRGRDIVNGGTMSICSIATETQRLLGKNSIRVTLATAAFEPRMLRFTKFENDHDILAFDDMLPRFPRGAEVVVHIPELQVRRFVADQPSTYTSRPDIKWRFNILLQNIDQIPSKELVDAVKRLGPTTATVAHEAYATPATAERLGCPVHFLSWRLSPEGFERVGYAQKKKLIVISPDQDPAKAEIVQLMKRVLPDHDIVQVRNMTYQQYLDLIKFAKFGFTFGEGLDAYFIEPVFFGGVSMAIYNERFFTEEYRRLDGVFPRETVLSSVENFLKLAGDEAAYTEVANRQYDLLASKYNRDAYQKNIHTFYAKYFPDLYS